jgi:hypothetical protein
MALPILICTPILPVMVTSASIPCISNDHDVNLGIGCAIRRWAPSCRRLCRRQVTIEQVMRRIWPFYGVMCSCS